MTCLIFGGLRTLVYCLPRIDWGISDDDILLVFADFHLPHMMIQNQLFPSMMTRLMGMSEIYFCCVSG